MTAKDSRTSRRAFFLKGGAVLGAGVATTVGAVQSQVMEIEDREAIRALHLAWMALIEKQRYEDAGKLFQERARLDPREQAAFAQHAAYRQGTSRSADTLTLSEDRLRASATFHTEVEVCKPLLDDCTAAQMARLQGNVAERYWEAGRFDVAYVKVSGAWKITSLRYGLRAATLCDG